MTSSETYPKKKLLDKIDSSWKCILALIDHSVAFFFMEFMCQWDGNGARCKVFGSGQATEEERKWTRGYRRRTFPMENNWQ